MARSRHRLKMLKTAKSDNKLMRNFATCSTGKLGTLSANAALM
jgi:hypothetical protein